MNNYSIINCQKDKLYTQKDEEVLLIKNHICNKNLIIYPTDTVYGLGGTIFSKEVIKKIYYIKCRPKNLPLSVAVSDINMFSSLTNMTKTIKKLINSFLPGPLTIICPSKKKIEGIVSNDGLIGIRIPNNILMQECIKLSGPIITTSANKHKLKNVSDIQEAINIFGNDVGLYVDYGQINSGIPSTIISVKHNSLTFLREGTISEKEILNSLK